MINALLLDLDGTLLDNDMDRFLPAYLGRLAAHMAHVAEPERFTRVLLAATDHMMANQDPARTLRQAFAERFYPAFGAVEEDMRHELEAFYGEVFPTLQPLTAPRPEARQLVEHALQAGLKVAVATNPLFPRTAIEQRLAWAGLNVDHFDFETITSYEDFHFAKPNPAYYAEVLGRLGAVPHEAAMIGDDPALDLEPARLLGMAVFHVGTDGSDFPGGDLSDALAWLKEQAAGEVNAEAAARPQAILARLRGHLGALLGMAANIEPQAWTHCPGPGEWAPIEVICHLRDVEREIHHPRIEAILSQERPFLAAQDSDLWARERDYRAQDPDQVLGEFQEARKETIQRLETQQEAAWERSARHSLLGPTTLREVMSMAAEHDLLHLIQLGDCLHTPRREGTPR